MVTIMDSFGMTESLEGALASVIFFSRKTGIAQSLFVREDGVSCTETRWIFAPLLSSISRIEIEDTLGDTLEVEPQDLTITFDGGTILFCEGEGFNVIL